MMSMTPSEIAEAVGGTLIAGRTETGAGEPTVTATVSDSRQAGDGSLFVAIRGERVDGHDFVADVAEKGAVAAIVEHEVPGTSLAQIVVPDSVRALGDLARHNIVRRRALDAPFTEVGITGSVGKTTTKDLLKAMLAELGETVAPIGSFNNEIGMPLTALKVGERTRFLVSEMGASHVGEIAHLTSIAPPDIAVVLKVGCAHLGEFGSVERIAQAKSELVRGLVPHGASILNADDPHVAAMAAIAPGDVEWFGRGVGFGDGVSRPTALAALDVRHDELDHPSFTLARGDARADVHLSICGDHNVMNALAAATVADRLGLPLERIARVLSDQRHISPHRMAVSRIRRDGVEFTLIDDSFNANPDSMRAGLDGLAAWGASRADGRKATRIGVLGAYAVSLGLDAVVAVGSAKDPALDALAADLAEGARGEARSAGRDVPVESVHDVDRADAAVFALASGAADPVVLLKGSHASGLSALAERWAANAVGTRA